jgi:hypothetical protein
MSATTAGASSIADFIFVDTAVGGVWNRNQVMPLADFRPPPDAQDVYATYLRYTRELPDYANTNPHVEADDRPSVKGFRGQAFAPFFPADFDCAGDLNQPRRDVIRAVKMLEARFDLPLSAVRLAFSGRKGFSLEIPGSLFGDFAPGAEIPSRFKRLGGELFADFLTIDTSIYEGLRLWRLPNYRHAKSGLFKIRLSLDELEHLRIDEIQNLATAARPHQDVPDDDWFPRAGLVHVWASTAIPKNGYLQESADCGPDVGSRAITHDHIKLLIEIVTRHWFASQKHNVALGLAGWLVMAGVPEEQGEDIFRTLSADDTRPDDRLNCLRDTYKRRRMNLAIAGPSRLREYLPRDDMDALERILPTHVHIHRLGSNVTSDAADAGQGDATPEARPIFDICDQDLERGTNAAWDAVKQANDPPNLFVYSGLPTRIDRDETTGAPIPRELDPDRLRNTLARAATFVRTTAKGAVVSARPPVALVKDMLAEPSFPLPHLTAITEVPIFACDGTLPSAPGYHPAAQTYYAPSRGFVVSPIPEEPTPDEVVAARELLEGDLLGDFPFIHDAERAHAVALLLLPFARNLIDGPTPLHLIEKPSPGTGATLLVDAIATIATGRPAPAMTEGRDEDDMRKRLTAALLMSPAIMFFDNLRRPLDYSCLAAAITETNWKDRVLGTSTMASIPVTCAWCATGNNPTLSSEMARRTISIRLNAKQAQPWLRSGFRHPNLRAWVKAHRAALVAACLTLIQAWIAKDRPAASNLVTIGMFEEWSSVMAGILENAGIAGFLENREDFYTRSDTEGSDVRGFLTAWWETHHATKVKVSTLFAIANAPDSTIDISAKTEQAQRVRLGKFLCAIEDRHYQLDDRLTVRVVRTGEKEKGAVLWRLENGASDSQNGESEWQETADLPADSPGVYPHNHAENQDDHIGPGESGESVFDTQRMRDQGEEDIHVSGSVETDSRHSPDSPDPPRDDAGIAPQSGRFGPPASPNGEVMSEAHDTATELFATAAVPPCPSCGAVTDIGRPWCFDCDPLTQ